MNDLTTLAAQRCAELANGLSGLDIYSSAGFEQCNWPRLAFRQFVEQAHHLATEALAHPERAAEILGPMILVEPVDAVMEEAVSIFCNAWDARAGLSGREANDAAIAIIADALRQREGDSHAG